MTQSDVIQPGHNVFDIIQARRSVRAYTSAKITDKQFKHCWKQPCGHPLPCMKNHVRSL